MILLLYNHTVLFLYPRQPRLNRTLYQVGVNWILISWNRNPSPDNVSIYEVEYSYAGDCHENAISRDRVMQTTGGTNLSYNITSLPGAHLNYSITLVAVNGTGRGPPNTDYATTRSMGACGVHMVIVVYVNA